MFIFRCMIFTLLLFSTAASISLAETENSPDLLASIVAQALENNPDLKAATDRWQLFEHRVVPAGSLPDPSLSFSLVNYPIDTFKGDQTPMTGKDIKWTQKIPYPGKLASKAGMARQQAYWYKSVLEDARLSLVQKVKDAYYELYFQTKAIVVTEKSLKILDDFTRLTETMYELGTGIQQDVLKAHVERSKLMDRLIVVKQQRETALARLNSLRNRPTWEALDNLPELILPQMMTSIAALQERALATRPIFDGYRSIIERAKQQRKLARLDYRPDFTLWGGYRFREEISGGDDGTDFISAGVSINLPFNRKKRDEGVAEASSALSMAHAQMNEMRNRVKFSIHDAYIQADKDRTQALLYQTGIIPQAKQAYLASLSAYQVDKVDFLTLLDGLMALYRYEVEYHRAATDYLRDLARLEAAVGTDLDRDST